MICPQTTERLYKRTTIKPDKLIRSEHRSNKTGLGVQVVAEAQHGLTRLSHGVLETPCTHRPESTEYRKSPKHSDTIGTISASISHYVTMSLNRRHRSPSAPSLGQELLKAAEGPQQPLIFESRLRRCKAPFSHRQVDKSKC